jgi:H+/Cl- antiporter ClcA
MCGRSGVKAGLCVAALKSHASTLSRIPYESATSLLQEEASPEDKRLPACGKTGWNEARKRGALSAVMEFNKEVLWLVPVAIAVCFLLWVLWNWMREERRSRRQKAPMRYSRR